MLLTKVYPQKDGSLVLPPEALHPLKLQQGSELILEKADDTLASEGVYLILRKPLIPERQARLRQQQVAITRTSLNKVYAHLDDPGIAMLLFYEFREALEQLWNLSRMAGKPYRRIVTLMQMSARRLREKQLEVRYLDALSAVLAKLKTNVLTDDDIRVCDDLLRAGGVDVMMALPAKVLQSYYEELDRDAPSFHRNDSSN
ncbi:MAG: hypothetical protein KKD28_13855 [Chloroflexi bacterium]|nr:hypothetical protein [Chloroflexota bacterium]